MPVDAQFRAEHTVTGMTCEHCVRSVTEELGEIAGVRSVDVELETGAVTVLAEREIRRDELAAAIEEAGYGLAD